MKSFAFIMFAAFSLLGPAHKRGGAAAWPSAMPQFAGGAPDCAYELTDGTSFASLTTLRAADEVLAAARAEYEAAGWRVARVATRDMLIFTRGTAVAVVLAESTARGTRITSILRDKE